MDAAAHSTAGSTLSNDRDQLPAVHAGDVKPAMMTTACSKPSTHASQFESAAAAFESVSAASCAGYRRHRRWLFIWLQPSCEDQ